MPLVPCRECGQSVSTEASTCPHCGCSLPASSPASVPPTQSAGPQPPAPPALPSGNDPALLPHVRGWNWGAFFLPWIWAFAHGSALLAVLALLGWFAGGIVGLAIAIYLGVKGNELAWMHRPFQSLEHFREVQRIWRNWGIALFLLQVFMVVLILIVTILLRLINSGGY
jgi:hypothetical protein